MVYLVCFDKPYVGQQAKPTNKLMKVRHYIGFTVRKSHKTRLEEHQKGRGSKLLRAVAKAGIPFDVVKTWPKGDRTFERSLKKQRNAPRFCPNCSKG
jgi:hypothetical protein